METIRAILDAVMASLGERYDTGRLDAELLLAQALGKPRSHLYAWPERQLGRDELLRFQKLIERRAAGEPIAYLLGRREFWSLELEVSPSTLIPRPETECLVEQALKHIPSDAHWLIADLGTGSGAIALAIASERPRCRILATDIYGTALEVARRNAGRLHLDNVSFVQGDWCAPLRTGRFQVILSNPPYIRETDPHLRQGDVRFEPRGALAAGADGLASLRRIAEDVREHLAPPALLLLEHGFDQEQAVHLLLERVGYRDISTIRDLANHPRVTQACYPQKQAKKEVTKG